ncbi:MAG: LLM class F420-dependent oxidoreductase [Acidimicrobiales bacterium]
MKFGIMFASTGRFANPDGAAAIATAAEECGLESIWSVEHVVIPDGYQSKYPYHESGKIPGSVGAQIPDPLIWLTYVAALTTRIRLATGILILPQRNPLVLAKECATLDLLSGGRLELGIGVGWLEEEFNALGIPWERRGARSDEYIKVLRTLWTEEKASFQGEFAAFNGAISNPKPVQKTVPILIGGHSKAAARRAGRLGDGFFPVTAGEDELVDILELMRSEAKAAGRDPASIEVTAGSWSPKRDSLDKVRQLEDLGVHRLILAPPAGPDKIREAMAALAETIAPVSQS